MGAYPGHYGTAIENSGCEVEVASKNGELDLVVINTPGLDHCGGF